MLSRVSFLNVLDPPYLILHSFDFTTLMQYLSKNDQLFTP